MRHQVCVLRGLFRVVALLRQHAPPADLCSFVLAHRSSSLGRAFPTLFDAVSGLLSSDLSPSFRGVALRSVEAERAHDSVQTMCLGPTCQCESVLRQRQAAWDDLRRGQSGRRQAVGSRAVSSRVVACPRGAARGRAVGVRVPRYVAYPSDEAKKYRCAGPCGCTPGAPCRSYCEGLLSTPPRYMRKPRNCTPPPGTHTKGMFRQVWAGSGQVSVCQVRRRAEGGGEGGRFPGSPSPLLGRPGPLVKKPSPPHPPAPHRRAAERYRTACTQRTTT